MGVQFFVGLPLLPEENNDFSLHILVAIAAYAALLMPDRIKKSFKGLQDFFPFFWLYSYLDSGIDHGFISLRGIILQALASFFMPAPPVMVATSVMFTTPVMFISAASALFFPADETSAKCYEQHC